MIERGDLEAALAEIKPATDEQLRIIHVNLSCALADNERYYDELSQCVTQELRGEWKAVMDDLRHAIQRVEAEAATRDMSLHITTSN